MRRFLRVLLVWALLPAVPAGALENNPAAPSPTHRARAWIPRPPGTKTTIKLQYGPYVVHPGSDLTRLDFEVVGASGFVIKAKPTALRIDGTPPASDEIHIHHAHWAVLDHRAPGGYRWFFGTGEERTQGGGEERMQVDPHYAEGIRAGVQLRRGEVIAFASMLHNKSPRPHAVWLEAEMEYVHGTREEILAATGLDYHALTPVLHGATFNVPRTSGLYAWPRDLPGPPGTGPIRPGVGHIWESPFDGTIVVASGHLHPGGVEVVVSNLGTAAEPCPDEGDGFAGKTILRVGTYYHNGVFPSEDFQMGISKPGWRARVRRGDRIAINGVYDSSQYANPDAMSFFGFYADTSNLAFEREPCEVELVDDPGADIASVVATEPNRPWDETLATCTVCDDLSEDEPLPGLHANQVTIAGFDFLPGNRGLSGEPAGPPVVARGERLAFVNADWAEGLVRHTVTSCRSPCNGPYRANYPFGDGTFHSGALGATPLDTYINVQTVPRWELDTQPLEPGRYTYYCRLHPWMRGSFFVA